ncbi:hypothetical protein GAYE_SCF65G6762 [Galdieria yellowstonensis]|uniref:Uncharacterized protein n=1 Tax=Galdieria yellowstonensis TaxID=3028027 RepID=A0AAV9IN08_9RHOD|nr:hypothetical protein GAYE_SCF65G6762 [Galdieria yellowstonensis]
MIHTHPPRLPLWWQSLSTGDWILVGTTGAILLGVGLLQRSLGDVIRDEAQLPSASSARTKREANRSKRFLDPKKRKLKDPPPS